MGVVNFTVTISGGAGDLNISFDNIGGTLHFDETNPGPRMVALPVGVNNYTIDGNSPPGGNVHLDVNGDIAAPESRDFGAGPILPQTFPIYVTK